MSKINIIKYSKKNDKIQTLEVNLIKVKEEFKEKINKLQAKLNQSENDKTLLSKENENLKSINKDLNSSNKELNIKIHELQEHKTNDKEFNNNADNEYLISELKEENKLLSEKVSQLEKEVENLDLSIIKIFKLTNRK